MSKIKVEYGIVRFTIETQGKRYVWAKGKWRALLKILFDVLRKEES